MPYKPRRGCFHPGCPNLTEVGQTYCKEHKAQHQRKIDRGRGTPAQRGYDKEWSRLRLAYLGDHPICVVCGQLATMVDHILPIKDGGTNLESNLQAMCGPCHRAKTNKEDGGYGNIRPDG